MNKRILIAFFFVISSFAAFSQQDMQITHYMFTKLLYNPAYAGFGSNICGTVMTRQQWVGFTDQYGEKGLAPTQYVLSVNGKVNVLSSGFGLNIYSDELAQEKATYINLNYSFHRIVGPGELGIGAALSIFNKTWDFPGYQPRDAGDQVLAGGDETDMLLDMSFGAYFKAAEWWVSLSGTQLLESVASLPTNSAASPTLDRTFYLAGGYEFEYGTDFTIKPSALIKTDLASMQFDLTALAFYQNQVYAGLNYRVNDAISILVGYQIGDMIGGYSYDITTSKVGSGSRSHGTHEVYYRYCIDIVLPPKPPTGSGVIRSL